MRFQDEIGMDVIVDGEQYRGDMVAFFAEELEGFTRGGLVRSYGNRYYRKPVITGELRRTHPITLEWWPYCWYSRSISMRTSQRAGSTCSQTLMPALSNASKDGSNRSVSSQLTLG